MRCPWSGEPCECPGRCDVDVLMALYPESDLAKAADRLRVASFMRASVEAL